jgi:hypothetical protein
MDIQPISMELSENMKRFIEFNEYAYKEWNKFILSQRIPKEREGQQECISNTTKKLLTNS